MGSWIYTCMAMLGMCHASPSHVPRTTESLKLLAFGGIVDGTGSTQRTVDKIDPTKANTECQSVGDIPERLVTTQNFGNQLIVSCGTKSCYSYDASTNGWKEYATLAERRENYASVLVNDHEMWILGGFNSDQIKELETTEIVSAKTNRARRGPDLPEKMSYHCAVKVNATHVFIGNSDERRAYMVNVSEEPFEFTRLPDMQQSRYGTGCGFIKMKNGEESGMSSEGNGEPAIIVAGGVGSPSTSSEIFLVEKNQWVEGPALPRMFQEGGSVNPDDQTFILAGGLSDHSKPWKPQPPNFSDVFQLDVESMKFVPMPAKLKRPRAYFTMTWMMDQDQC